MSDSYADMLRQLMGGAGSSLGGIGAGLGSPAQQGVLQGISDNTAGTWANIQRSQEAQFSSIPYRQMAARIQLTGEQMQNAGQGMFTQAVAQEYAGMQQDFARAQAYLGQVYGLYGKAYDPDMEMDIGL